jgi:anti-sigma B factor antagonist
MHRLPDDEGATALAKLCSMRVEKQLGTTTILLHGEFDLACAERFEEELGRALDSETEKLVLDLRGLEFIDSTGLRMLVKLHNLADQDHFVYTVLARDGQVGLILHQSGLDRVLPVVDPSGAVPVSESPVSPK